MLVTEDHRLQEPVQTGAHVHAGPVQQPRRGPQPCRGVVVAAGHDDRGPCPDKLGQGVVPLADGLHRCDGPVEHVPRHDDHVDGL